MAADVCKALGAYIRGDGRVNTTMSLSNLSPDEIKAKRIDLQRGGHPQKLISESGLYKLVMRSDKPEAKAFQDWVTRDVLPAIRKDGMYVQGEEQVVTGEMSME